jgi:hypothetical protein
MLADVADIGDREHVGAQLLLKLQIELLFVPRLTRVTLAFGMTAPVESVTVPRISAVVNCANAADVNERKIIKRKTGGMTRGLSVCPHWPTRFVAALFLFLIFSILVNSLVEMSLSVRFLFDCYQRSSRLSVLSSRE